MEDYKNVLFKYERHRRKVTASQAIIKGISSDGGLYVPSEFPNVKNELINLVNLTYSQIAFCT